jgi:hypothetical protein
MRKKCHWSVRIDLTASVLVQPFGAEPWAPAPTGMSENPYQRQFRYNEIPHNENRLAKEGIPYLLIWLHAQSLAENLVVSSFHFYIYSSQPKTTSSNGTLYSTPERLRLMVYPTDRPMESIRDVV